MSEYTPEYPDGKTRLRPDEDEPDVEGHVLPEKAKLNPDAYEADKAYKGDEPYEDEAPGKSL